MSDIQTALWELGLLQDDTSYSKNKGRANSARCIGKRSRPQSLRYGTNDIVASHCMVMK